VISAAVLDFMPGHNMLGNWRGLKPSRCVVNARIFRFGPKKCRGKLRNCFALLAKLASDSCRLRTVAQQQWIVYVMVSLNYNG
jgi:hypothetical protein